MNVFNLPKDHYKIEKVEVKVKDRFEPRKLERLSSQTKQEILDRTRDCIRGLSALRRKGGTK
jgi:hypothetical protein